MAPFIALVGGSLVTRLIGFIGVEALDDWRTAVRIGLSLMFLLTGFAHFAPRMRSGMIAMVPPRLPAAGLLVTATGIAELAGAAGLWIPATATVAAWCLALLLIAMFPANVYAARHGVKLADSPPTPLGIRTAQQLLYLAAAVFLAVLFLFGGRPVRSTTTLPPHGRSAPSHLVEQPFRLVQQGVQLVPGNIGIAENLVHQRDLRLHPLQRGDPVQQVLLAQCRSDHALDHQRIDTDVGNGELPQGLGNELPNRVGTGIGLEPPLDHQAEQRRHQQTGVIPGHLPHPATGPLRPLHVIGQDRRQQYTVVGPAHRLPFCEEVVARTLSSGIRDASTTVSPEGPPRLVAMAGPTIDPYCPMWHEGAAKV